MIYRSYSELVRLGTFEERFEYLRLGGVPGHETFGLDRRLNQAFYDSYAWQQAREWVIIRDNGCDLGLDGFPIHDRILVHHMTPIAPDDILRARDWIIDPEFLITTNHDTHNAIHYSAESPRQQDLITRRPGDTTLW